MNEILLKAVKLVLNSNTENKEENLEKMLGSDYVSILDESVEDWRDKL